jgi:large subunit ribosomal protein L29
MKSTTKMRELREKGEGDLTHRERELAEQLFALRLQKVTGQLEKPSKIRSAKRELARVLTVRNELRRGIVTAPAAPVQAAPASAPKAKASAPKEIAAKAGAKKSVKRAAKSKEQGAGQ